MSLAVRRATIPQRSVSQFKNVSCVMFVTIHLVGRMGTGGGTSGEFSPKVAQQVNSHNQAAAKQYTGLQILTINRVKNV